MMEQQKLTAGGVQFIPQLAAVQQIIYLNFDIESTSYNNEVPTPANAEVQDSFLNAERIAGIIDRLNTSFSPSGIRFVTEAPGNEAYSAIFISDAGSAETVEKEFLNRSGSAVILIDRTGSDAEIISAISSKVNQLSGSTGYGSKNSDIYVQKNGETITGEKIISSGDVLENAAIGSNGSLHILKDGIANSTTVGSRGHMTVSSGGLANKTTVNTDGIAIVSSGGSANSVTVNSRGYLRVYETGEVNALKINSGGVAFIYSGGTATDIDWTPCVGSVNIADGAYATFKSNYSGVYLGSGNVLLSSASSMNGKSVAGSMYIMNNGMAENTTVNRGSVWVAGGGSANNITLNGGAVFVSDGAEVNDAVIQTNGTLNISNGGSAGNVTVHSRGYMYIREGGCVDTLTVNSGGIVQIYSGGTATNIIWTPCVGTLRITEGADAVFANTYSGVYFGSGDLLLSSAKTMNDKDVTGSMYVMNDGIANSTLLYSRGSMFISSGGIANSTTLNAQGVMYISSHGQASDTVINDRGYMCIQNGGSANNITLNNGGVLNISSGGTATNLDWTPCIGSLTVDENAYVTYAGNHSGVYYGSNNTLVSHAMNMSDQVVVQRASMYVMDKGIATSTIVGFEIDTSSGNSTTLSAFADLLYVSSGGTVYDTTLNWGYLWLRGGTANSTQINCGGNFWISAGAVANSITVNSSGFLYVSSGGTANAVNVAVSGQVEVFSSGVVNSAVLKSASVFVYSGGSVNSASLDADGYLRVSEGTVNSTTINSAGYLRLYDGGVAQATTVKSNGFLHIYDGGHANSTTLSSGGNLAVSSGGSATSTTVKAGGSFSLHPGGSAEKTNVSSASFYVYDGGHANSTTLTEAKLWVYEGTANSTTLNSNSYFVVSSGGSAGVTLISSGTFYVYDGARADSTTVEKGTFWVSGGTVNSVTVNNGGSLRIYDQGDVNSVTINSGAALTISSGGTAANITMNSGGTLNLNSGGVISKTDIDSAKVYIYDGTRAYYTSMQNGTLWFYGGTLSSTTMNSNGILRVHSGANAKATTVNNNASLVISSGGKAVGTTVNSGGELKISAGGIHSGSLQIDSAAAFVRAYDGATVDFTVAGRSVNDSYLINNLSLLTGNPTYTITVSDTQESGSYKLAQGASSFSTSVSIGNGKTGFGTLTVNSNTVRYNGTSYTLKQSNGNLTLNVVSSGTPDLCIRDYEVSSTSINKTGSVKLTFKYVNNGTGTAAASVLKVFDGDTLLRTFSMGSIAAGDSRNCTVTVNGSTLGTGARKLYVVADADNQITESSESNNRAYRTVTVKNVAVKADLCIKNYEVSSTSIGKTGSVKLNFNYANTGNGNAAASVLKVYDGDTLLRTFSMGTLAAGSSRNCTVTVNGSTLGTGARKLYVVADADNQISESNENNNRAYRTVTVKNMPDLCIQNYEVSSTSIGKTGSVKLNFKYTNKGTAAAAASVLKVYDGDTLLRTFSMGTLAAGSSRNCTVTVNGSTLGTGARKLYVVADADNQITEADENNNSSYRIVTVKNMADLCIQDYEVSSTSIYKNDSVKLTFKYTNKGTLAAPASVLKVYDGDTLLRTLSMDSVSAGSYRNATVTILGSTLGTGARKLYLTVDADNQVTESDENNNRAYRTVTVKSPADLCIQNYEVSNTSISKNESVVLSFKYANNGAGAAGASVVKVYDGDTLLRTLSMDSVDAGGYRNATVTIRGNMLGTGARKLYLVADADNQVAESNEANNRSYRTITVNDTFDLFITDYEYVKQSDSVVLSFKYVNNGTGTAAPSVVKVYDGDTLLRTVSMTSVAAGSYLDGSITINNSMLGSGARKLYLVADADNQITETNEDNNSAYRTVSVNKSEAAAAKEDNFWNVSGTGSTIDALCDGNYADLSEWSLENSAALTRSAADILTTGNEESRLLNSGKLAG